MSLIKKTIKWILVVLLGILGIGTLCEQLFQYYLNTEKPPANAFCELNGVKIHFVKKGSGGPTVVFQSGLGGDYKIWEEIQDSLSKQTTTISYDRAGLQWSEAGQTPKTLANITSELEQLLEKTNCPKPYILVGHSLAGITLRPFIHQHQKEIAGIVFADVSHPLQLEKSSLALRKYLVVPPTWLLSFLMETGMARSYFSVRPFISALPATHWMNKHVRDYFYRSYKTFLQEARADDAMFGQAAKYNSFGDIPLTILTGAYPNRVDFLENPLLANEYLSLHRALQKDLLKLSTHSQQRIAKNSGHYVPLQDAPLLIQSVQAYLKPLP